MNNNIQNHKKHKYDWNCLIFPIYFKTNSYILSSLIL